MTFVENVTGIEVTTSNMFAIALFRTWGRRMYLVVWVLQSNVARAFRRAEIEIEIPARDKKRSRLYTRQCTLSQVGISISISSIHDPLLLLLISNMFSSNESIY